MMRELLSGTSLDDVSIYLEASSNSISSLLSVLTSGVAFTKNNVYLREVVNTAKLLDIAMNNWQIGEKKTKELIDTSACKKFSIKEEGSSNGIRFRSVKEINQPNPSVL